MAAITACVVIYLTPAALTVPASHSLNLTKPFKPSLKVHGLLTSYTPSPIRSQCPGYPHGGGPLGNPCAGNGTAGPIRPKISAEQQWLNTPVTQCVKQAESGGDYSIGGMEPFGGAWQFSVATWQGKDVGFTGLPNQASPVIQDDAAYKLYLAAGYSQWQTALACERKYS